MILAILQARMSSTRLPGKVLLPIEGAPLIARQIERAARAHAIDALIVATGDGPEDDAIAMSIDTPVHRGPQDDVTARILGALETHPADHVVRLAGNCPLADPAVIDACIALHLKTGADYTSNTPAMHPWPQGLEVEVIRTDALHRAAREAVTPRAREQVTAGIRAAPDRYDIAWLPGANPDDGEIRWIVDRADDYVFVTEVYAGLYPGNPEFTTADIRWFMGRRPDLARFGGDRRI